MKFATPRSIKNASLQLFNHHDERLLVLYDYLINICNYGDDRYHKLETKYHDLYHFLTSTSVFLDVYASIDGCFKVGEYIREGFDFTKFHNNLLLSVLQKYFSQKSMMI